MTAKKMKKPVVRPESKLEPVRLPAGVTPGREAILAGEIVQVRLDKIDIIKKHDREAMTDAELKIPELAQSIATAGLQQPIRVVPHNGDRYALVFGERRVRAARLLRHERISAVVVSQDASGGETDRRVAEARAVENIQRVDPSPIGEAAAIADIFDIKLEERIEQWRDSQEGATIPSKRAALEPTVSAMAMLRAEAIARTADRVGKPVAWVRDRMFLAGFGSKARDLVSLGRLPLAHAKEIAKVADPRRRDELAERFAAGPAGTDAGYRHGEDRPGDIRVLRREVAKSMWSLSQAPWSLDQAFAGKPACEECPHNSRNAPGLFEGKVLFADDPKRADKLGRFGGPSERPEPKSGICQKPDCYKEKNEEASRALSGTVSKVINRYKLAKAAKKPGASKLLEIPAIRDLTPAFVSSSAVKERVRARFEAKAKKTSAAPVNRRGPLPGEYGTPEYEARRRGEARYRDAVHDWRHKIAEPAFVKYLQEVPGRWAMYALVQRGKLFQRACRWNAKPKDFQSAELLAALRLIEKPSMESVLKIEKHCGEQFGLDKYGDYGRAPEMFMHSIVSALGIAIEKPPVEEDFVKEKLDALKRSNAVDTKRPAAKKPMQPHQEADE